VIREQTPVGENEEDAKLLQNSNLGDAAYVKHLAEGLWIVADADPHTLLATHRYKGSPVDSDKRYRARHTTSVVVVVWGNTISGRLVESVQTQRRHLKHLARIVNFVAEYLGVVELLLPLLAR
jgi:hypothetical protein